MGFFRKLEDKVKSVGRKIDDEILQPIKENPAAAVVMRQWRGLRYCFVQGGL